MRIYIIAILIVICSCEQDNKNDTNFHVEEIESNLDSSIVEGGVDSVESIIEKEASIGLAEPVSEGVVSDELEDVDWADYEESQTRDFSFVILISTKSYKVALNRAKDASKKLGYPLDLRGLHPNEEIGLSLSKKECEEEVCGGGLDYPIYLPRSDWGEEKYVSVEYSNGYKGFTKGYYIVIVASGEKGDPIVDEALTESRRFYKDAYAKTCGVWVGCGC
ncbi:MAG: hypothetical protein MK066_05220 [Crocinitomicaceae bacterium]|nr:hypothetical protein [Crocinitomicaceae bacterium]